MRNEPKPQRIRIGDAYLYKTGTSRFELSDPYHLAMTVRWGPFFAGLVVCYLLINLVFAGLYTLQPGSISNSGEHPLRDAFFFSMETLATVGYGNFSPATTYGHVVAAVEIICGLAFTAIVTGIIFVRFSKVKPKMLFADKLVVNQHDGKPTLMVRVAYGRGGLLVRADARVHMLVQRKTTEGRSFRLARELTLVRSHLPILALTWTLMHTIDEDSPLYGLTPEQVIAEDLRTIVTIEAVDHSLSSDIFDLATYSADQIKYGMVYEDLVTVDDAQRTSSADVRKIGFIRPE